MNKRFVIKYAAHHLPGLSLSSFRQRDFVRELRSPEEGCENELHRKNVGTSISELESVVLCGRGNSDCLFRLSIIRLPFRQIINSRHLLEFADRTFDWKIFAGWLLFALFVFLKSVGGCSVNPSKARSWTLGAGASFSTWLLGIAWPFKD